MKTDTLKISGMTCGGCVNAVTKALRSTDGVNAVVVSLQASEARVEYDEQATSSERLRAAVERAGYSVEPAGSAPRPGSCCG